MFYPHVEEHSPKQITQAPLTSHPSMHIYLLVKLIKPILYELLLPVFLFLNFRYKPERVVVLRVLLYTEVIDMLVADVTFKSLASSTVLLSFCILVCPHWDIHLLGTEEDDDCREY